MIKVGDTVRLVRKKARTGGGTKPHECQIWETIEIPRDQQKVGLVIRDDNNRAHQMAVLVNGKFKLLWRQDLQGSC